MAKPASWEPVFSAHWGLDLGLNVGTQGCGMCRIWDLGNVGIQDEAHGVLGMERQAEELLRHCGRGS